MAAARTGSLFALIGVVLVGMVGFGIFLPIFPFLALSTGASPTEITIAMGAYSLGQLISAPLWGRLSDRVGRKPVLILGLIGAALSYLLLARADTIWLMGAARLFGGLMAGNVGAAFAAAADLADDKTRARNMGLLGAAFGLGFILGPGIAALLIGHEPDAAGFARVCYAASAFAGVAALGALALFRETLPPDMRGRADAPPVRRWALLASRPALARFIGVTLLMITAQALMESTFGLWADAELHWGPRQVGWAFVGLGLGAALMQGGVAGRAARVLGERMTLLIGLALFASGFGALAATREPETAIAAFVMLTLGVGLAGPALNSLIAAQADADERGAVMGLSQSASALGRVLGPAGAGALFDGFGSAAPFIFGAILLLAALFVATGGLAARQEPSPG